MNKKNNQITGGELIVSSLKNLGVKNCFGVPGESYLAVLDALFDNNVEFTICRQEGAASFASSAWGKLTGKPGICFVTRGPGATNISIAVHSAHQGGIPLVIFIGQVSRKNIGKMHLQEMDYTKTFSDMTKQVVEILDPEDLPNIISNAFKTAMEGIPGPVVISIPTDILEAEITSKAGNKLEVLVIMRC